MRFFALILTVVASLFSGQISSAQTIEQHKKWVVLCDPDFASNNQCLMRTEITEQDTGRHLLSVSVFYPKGRDRALLLFEMPAGIQTDKGVGMQIDQGRVQTWTEAKCQEGGCHIGVALDSATISRLKNGLLLRFAYVPTSGEGILIPVSLIGFTSAYNSLMSK